MQVYFVIKMNYSMAAIVENKSDVERFVNDRYPDKNYKVTWYNVLQARIGCIGDNPDEDVDDKYAGEVEAVPFLKDGLN